MEHGAAYFQNAENEIAPRIDMLCAVAFNAICDMALCATSSCWFFQFCTDLCSPRAALRHPVQWNLTLPAGNRQLVYPLSCWVRFDIHIETRSRRSRMGSTW